MLNGSRFFAEFPDENPDRAPMNPTVLCALVALEREISRTVQTEPETRIEAADGNSGRARRGATVRPSEGPRGRTPEC